LGLSTAYRKINGHVAFTAPEIQACLKLLDLDAETASRIFLPPICRKRHMKDNELNLARERVMADRILADAKAFYKDDENLRAFEAWMKLREEQEK